MSGLEVRVNNIEKSLDLLNGKCNSIEQLLVSTNKSLDEMKLMFQNQIERIDSNESRLTQLQKSIDKRESEFDPLNPHEDPFQKESNEEPQKPKEPMLTCRRCGEDFTLSKNTLCIYHDGSEHSKYKNNHYEHWRFYWTCCKQYYYKLKPKHSRNSDDDLQVAHGQYIPDHIFGCKKSDSHEAVITNE